MLLLILLAIIRRMASSMALISDSCIMFELYFFLGLSLLSLLIILLLSMIRIVINYSVTCQLVVIAFQLSSRLLLLLLFLLSMCCYCYQWAKFKLSLQLFLHCFSLLSSDITIYFRILKFSIAVVSTFLLTLLLNNFNCTTGRHV